MENNEFHRLCVMVAVIETLKNDSVLLLLVAVVIHVQEQQCHLTPSLRSRSSNCYSCNRSLLPSRSIDSGKLLLFEAFIANTLCIMSHLKQKQKKSPK